MKTLYLMAGAIFIVAPFFLAMDDLKSYKVARHGKVVEMEIIDKPSSCLGTKVKHYMKVKYQDKVFSKRIGGAYCEAHQKGDKVEIKYLAGMDRVLLPGERVIKEFIFEGIAIIFGLYVFWMGLKNLIVIRSAAKK
jgi:hypothetical protein